MAVTNINQSGRPKPVEESKSIRAIANEAYADNEKKIDLVYDAYYARFKENFHLWLSVPAGLEAPEILINEAIERAAGQIKTNLAVGSNWGSASKAYVNGSFESFLTQQTIAIAISLALQHPPVIKLPSSIKYLEDRMTIDGKDANQFLKDVLIEVSLTGRVPVLLDIGKDGKFHVVQYKAKSLIDWDEESVGIDSRQITYLKFVDFEKNPDFDPLTDNGTDRYIQVMFYHYLKNGIYTVEKYKAKKAGSFAAAELLLESSIQPSYKGKNLDFIPAVVIGSLNNTVEIDPCPMFAIANCDLKRVDISAMLAYAQAMSSGPTMYMTGVDEDEAPSVTGPGSLIALADSQARVGYTTTDTSAFISLRDEMQEYVSIAQELGASILGAKRGTSESGEALRLRQAAATASLKSIVANAGAGINLILEIASKWAGADIEEVQFEANEEFSTFALTANETIALVQAWQSTAISQSTLLENFRKAGMLQAGETVEDELKRLSIPGEEYEAPIDPNAGATGSPVEKKLDVGEDLPASTEMNKNIKS